MVARLSDSGQGAPAWTRRRSESNRSSGPELAEPEDALEVGGHQEGGGRAVPAEGIERARRVEAAEDGQRAAREQRAGREADGDGVVHRRAHQMEVGPVEVPHRGLVLEHGAGGRLVPQAGGHALGPPRGARGVVHRAGSVGTGRARSPGRRTTRPARRWSKTRRTGSASSAKRSRSASVRVALSSTGISPTRAAPRTAQMRSADEPRAKATRSPRVQPRASSAPAARRWRTSASEASRISTLGVPPAGTGAL